MSDLTIEKMNTGFAVAAIAIFVWASIDYNRFIKFWMLRPGAYSKSVRIVFRSFFLACVLGGVWQLADMIRTPSGRPATFYFGALLFAAAWFAAFFVMLHAVEWMNRKRGINQSRVKQP
jgi:hypothetical protein